MDGDKLTFDVQVLEGDLRSERVHDIIAGPHTAIVSRGSPNRIPRRRMGAGARLVRERLTVRRRLCHLRLRLLPLSLATEQDRNAAKRDTARTPSN